MAYFANGESITSEIVLLNLGRHPVRPAIQFSSPGGDLIAPASLVDVTRDLRITDDGRLATSAEMAPMGVLAISTRGEGPLVSGSVTVRSDGPVSGFLRHRVPELGVAVMASGEPVGDALLPARSGAGGIGTAVALHNVGAEAMVVECRLMSGGVAVEELRIPLAANGQAAWSVGSVTGTTDFRGLVRCTAPGEGRFTAAALQTDSGQRMFAAMPVLPVLAVDRAGTGGGATELNFVRFANGDGIVSDLVFVNPSTRSGASLAIPEDPAMRASRPTVYFHDIEGNPIAPASVVELTSDLRITGDGGLVPRAQIAPLGVVAISTRGQGELLLGSVRAVSDGPLAGFLRVGLPGAGVGVVEANRPVRDAIFATRRREGGTNTRVAIHNLESTTAVVRCDLMRRETLLETADFLLLANGQMSPTIGELFPGAAAADFAGSVVRCVGTGRFTATALESDPGTRTFTTVPAVTADEPRAKE